MQIICSPHQKKCFSTILGSFCKIEFLTEIRQAWTLQKYWNFCAIFNSAKKIFFLQIICSPHQKKCFSTILGSFVKLNFWRKFDRRGPYKNSEIFVLSSIVLRKYFLQTICSPHQKKYFSTILGSFWKIEFLTEIRQARTLQKIMKFLCYIQ